MEKYWVAPWLFTINAAKFFTRGQQLSSTLWFISVEIYIQDLLLFAIHRFSKNLTNYFEWTEEPTASIAKFDH